eukprot:TRINITY_DN66376_c9_g1_i2.p2 TRINITY_DN66376_c9_g1~~TRINITY_DN66376_c9_g1_i2.p2  ORF type:complete len:158 (+),score=85.60 TRINITY_DN66376_c9_g1_i2:188-661(+)
MLNNGEHVAIVRADGSFHFHDVPAGTYIMHAFHVDFVFEPMRVDVSNRDGGRVAASYVNKRGRVHNLAIVPRERAEYFQQRKPYDWTAMLKNPTMLIMGFMLLMVIVFPKMLNSMDPEELEQFRKTSMTELLSNPNALDPNSRSQQQQERVAAKKNR